MKAIYLPNLSILKTCGFCGLNRFDGFVFFESHKQPNPIHYAVRCLHCDEAYTVMNLDKNESDTFSQ